MSTKKTEAGTAAKAVETTNSNGAKVVQTEKSNFGRIAYTITTELSADKVDKILAEGVLHIAQRAPASRVEKILAGYEKRSDMPETWVRENIGYSDALARQFETELTKAVKAVAGIDVSVVAYEDFPDKAHAPKYAEAQKYVKNAIKMGGGALQRLAKNSDYTGGNLTVDNVEFLQAVDAGIKATLAAKLYA